MMPMEILNPCTAWGGQSVSHMVPGVCHTVPSPEHSQQDRSDKGKRNGAVHVDTAGRSPQLRSGLVGVVGDLRNIVLLITGVWLQVCVWLWCPGHQLSFRDTPAERQSPVLPQLPCWARLPAPRNSIARAVLELPEELKTCQSSAGMGREPSWGSANGELLNKRTCPATVQ